MKKRNLLIILSLFFLAKISSQTMITQYLPYDKYSVGYKLFHVYDYGRSYFPKYDYYGERTEYPIGRPMQISVWYPTQDRLSKKMRYGDYIKYTSSEIDFSKNDIKHQKEALKNFIDLNGSKAEKFNQILNEQIEVHFNAQELGINFPIILYAPPRGTSAHNNSILCEYLASKGYIVLSVGAKGEYMKLQSSSLKAAKTQSDDLAFLLDFAKKKYKSEKIGTLGFSLGGLSNILFAYKNKDVDATVSLDGSIMSLGWLRDLKKNGLYKPNEFTSNILLISKNLKVPKLNPSTFFDDLKFSNKALIRFNHSKHNYFSALHLLYDISEDTSENKAKKACEFYAEMAKYVVCFFDKYLKNIDAFKENTGQSFNHSFSFHKGTKKPPAPSSIGLLILDKGYPYTQKIINDILKTDSLYVNKISWKQLHQASNSLLLKNRYDDALKTVLLSDSIFPNWYKTHYKLGNLYSKIGNERLAEKHYLRALKDNPRDIASKKELEKMGKIVPDYHKVKLKDVTKYLGKYRVDQERYREIFLKEGKLFLYSNYWDKPIEIWPFSKNLFLVESDEGKHNMQILFQFDKDGDVVSLRIRGLNSGKLNNFDFKL